MAAVKGNKIWLYASKYLIERYFFAEKTRDRFVQLVSHAYSSISLTEFSNFVGMNEGQAEELAQRQPGWAIDAQTKMINPVKSEVKETESIPSEHQLRLLTDFVAFLEK